ncbi:tetratricopeptide repeat protein [Candidatus Omnitrophota bacterium]
MRKIILYSLIFTLILVTEIAFAGAKKEVKRGNLLYNKEDFKGALKKYEKALETDPNSDVVNFDLGTALYKTGDFSSATQHFNRALVTDDEKLEQKANYNLGNTEYRLGLSMEDSNTKGAVDLLKQALRHYEGALSIDSEDEEAKFNHEYVTKELKRIEEKLQKQESESQESKEGEEKEEKEGEQSQEQQAKQEQEAQQENAQQQEESEDDKEDKGPEEESAANAKEGEEQGGEDDKSSEQKALDKISKDQALMLLESYRQEEEPTELYREKIDTRDLGTADKDW